MSSKRAQTAAPAADECPGNNTWQKALGIEPPLKPLPWECKHQLFHSTNLLVKKENKLHLSISASTLPFLWIKKIS